MTAFLANTISQSLQLELKNIHGARRVRMTLAMFSFIRTPLLRGETRQWNFLFPLLHVETVADAIVEALLSGHGRTIYLPKIMRYVSILVRRHSPKATYFTGD